MSNLHIRNFPPDPRFHGDRITCQPQAGMPEAKNPTGAVDPPDHPGLAAPAP